LDDVGLLDLLRPRCPTCKKRGLRSVQFIRATIVVDGRSAPAAWSFYRCPECDGRFRLDAFRQDEGLRVARDDEWRQFVDGHGPFS
jgi:hypothetical protein